MYYLQRTLQLKKKQILNLLEGAFLMPNVDIAIAD